MSPPLVWENFCNNRCSSGKRGELFVSSSGRNEERAWAIITYSVELVTPIDQGFLWISFKNPISFLIDFFTFSQTWAIVDKNMLVQQTVKFLPTDLKHDRLTTRKQGLKWLVECALYSNLSDLFSDLPLNFLAYVMKEEVGEHCSRSWASSSSKRKKMSEYLRC